MKTFFYKKYLLVFSILAIFFVSYVSLWDITKYYFFTDDYATLYHTQNNLSIGFPYVYLAVSFYPFYKLFGINPFPYFVADFVIYFIAGVLLFLFLKLLTKNTFVSFFSALIFATGYICIDEFTQVVASSISNFNLVLMLLALIFTVLWVDTKKIKYYILTLLVFWASMIIIPVRAFPLVLFLPTVEFILRYSNENLLKTVKNFIFICVRFIPFMFLAIHYGVFSYGGGAGSGGINGFFSGIVSKISFFSQPTTLKNILDILGKTVFIEPFVRFVWAYPRVINYPLLGLILCIGIIFFCLHSLREFEKSRLKKSLLILLLISIEGFIGFLTISEITTPTNRYLIDAKIGLSGIVPLIIYLIFILNKKIKKNFAVILGPILLVYYVFLMLNLSKQYEVQHITNGFFAREYYSQFRSYLPKLSKGDIVYVDSASRYPVPSRLRSIIGSALMSPEVNLAFHYRIPVGSIKVIDKFEDVRMLVSKNPSLMDNLHTFYYDEKGLLNTTNQTISMLKSGYSKNAALLGIKNEQIGKSPSATVSDINFPSVVPYVLKFSLKVTQLPASEFSFPFSRSDSDIENMVNIRRMYKEGSIDKNISLQYLLSRKKYYDMVNVNVSSQDKTYTKDFLLNKNINDSWVDNQNTWEVNIKPWIILDLGEERIISKIVWNLAARRIPKEYEISVSTDKKNWSILNVKHLINNLSDDSREVSEVFSPVAARYVKFDISKTENGFAPGVSEIEVIENRFSDVDRESALRISKNPFEYIRNESDLENTYNFLSEAAVLSVDLKTNKDEKINTGFKSTIPIFLDGLFHDYQLQVPAGGTVLEDVRFSLNFPAELDISSMQIENFPVKDIVSK